MPKVLYGARGGSAGTSDLYVIDPLTAVPTSLGPIGFALTGLAYDATAGILYGVTSHNSSANPHSLIRVDRDTGAGTLVGNLALGSDTCSDISVSPGGVLYGWSHFSEALATIDKATGAGTEIGPPGGIFGGGLEFVIGVLYHLAAFIGDDITTVDTSTGDETDTGVPVLQNQLQAAAYDGASLFISSSTGGASHIGTVDLATGAVTDIGVVFASGAPLDAIAWVTLAEPIAPPTQVFGGTRFYEAPLSRMIVSDLNDNILTFVDKLAMDRSVTVTRAAARVISFRVPSDNPEINIPTPGSAGEPFVSEGGRLVSWFRREGRTGSLDAPWRIRARGLTLDDDDDADTDHATSTFTAYDPWKYLYRRPILLSDGSLPGEKGRVYPAGTSADEIITEQFQLAIDTGGTIFTDFGQTPYYGGTIEACDPLPDGGDGIAVAFAAGATLGEMLDVLVATGTCDVVFDPIYDTANRPGLLCDLSIYQQAGSFRANAIMGWDRWPRSVVQLSRQVAGTERANRLQMYAGQGGPPVPEENDAVSIAQFGEYWATQYLPGVPSIGAARTIARRQLQLLKDGQYTYALSPAAERAPLLFEEYREADTLPLYASDRFRDPIDGVPLRVESIPIVIGDDQLERVNQMLVSFAPEDGS